MSMPDEIYIKSNSDNKKYWTDMQHLGEDKYTSEAKKQEEIEQARKETRQQCEDTYWDKSNEQSARVARAIRNSGLDKGEGE